MGFNRNETQKSKNQFAARVISNKTGAMVGWFHPVDDFARRVCGVNTVADITAAQAEEFIPQFVNNERVSVVVTDMTATVETVAVNDF